MSRHLHVADWLSTLDPDKVQEAVDSYDDAPIFDRVRRYTDNPRFGVWLYLCDKRVRHALGVSLFDMPDQLWRDRFEAVMSPAEAVAEAMDDWREDGDLFGLVADFD